MVVFVALLGDFGPMCMPKWSQSGTKVDAKTDMNTKRPQSLKVQPVKHGNDIRRVRGVRFQSENWWKNGSRTKPRWKWVRGSIFHRFGVDFGRVWGGKTDQKSIQFDQNRTKGAPRTPQGASKQRDHGFTQNFGPPWGSRGGLLGAQSSQKNEKNVFENRLKF